MIWLVGGEHITIPLAVCTTKRWVVQISLPWSHSNRAWTTYHSGISYCSLLVTVMQQLQLSAVPFKTKLVNISNLASFHLLKKVKFNVWPDRSFRFKCLSGWGFFPAILWKCEEHVQIHIRTAVSSTVGFVPRNKANNSKQFDPVRFTNPD